MLLNNLYVFPFQTTYICGKGFSYFSALNTKYNNITGCYTWYADPTIKHPYIKWICDKK